MSINLPAVSMETVFNMADTLQIITNLKKEVPHLIHNKCYSIKVINSQNADSFLIPTKLSFYSFTNNNKFTITQLSNPKLPITQ